MAGNAPKINRENHNRNWAPPLRDLHNTSLVQTKLEIGQPKDRYEKQADKVMMAPYDRSNVVMMAPNPDNPTLRMMPMPKKDMVMMAPNPDNPTLRMMPELQRNEQMGYEEEEKVQMTEHGEEEEMIQPELHQEEEEMVQTKCTECEEKEMLQTKHAKNETGMPNALKSGLENLSGVDLSGVRVHRNSSKPEAIQAHAFTQGQEIHLAPGQEKHLPHEGWHAVQQMQGRVAPTIQKKDALINDDADLEKEADVMGDKAVQMKANDSDSQTKNTGTSTNNNGVIQRAMKFEYQVRYNYLMLDDGTNVNTLPRKFGPRDYLMRDSSGATLETETGGQIEFETSWEKKWPKLKAQIEAIQKWGNDMEAVPATETGSDLNMYRKFPPTWDITHLSANTGSRESSSSDRWSRNQKPGKAIVSRSSDTFENFRSSPEYDKNDPDVNFISKIDNDTKVFVHYTEGGWSRIEHEGVLGWMVSNSLTASESKQYEQNNPDGAGNLTDKPMDSGDKLLIDITDPTWLAYTQISESMELEQYESYLEQFDSHRAATLTVDADDIIKAFNPQTAPVGETPADKTIREDAFLDANVKLKNLLLMVTYYAEKGASQSTGSLGDPGSAKFALSLMSRTHFGSIFKSMSPSEQTLFTTMVDDLTSSGLINKMGLTDQSLFFVHGTSKGLNPTVHDWLESITDGGDILSTQSVNKLKLPGAMGRYNMEEETGKQAGLMRMEGRRTTGNEPLLKDLLTHAEDHFDKAIALRPRTTGTGNTGLEK